MIGTMLLIMAALLTSVLTQMWAMARNTDSKIMTQLFTVFLLDAIALVIITVLLVHYVVAEYPIIHLAK